jgi:hypothetical protein
MKNTLILIALLFSLSAKAEIIPGGWELASTESYLKEDVQWYKGNMPNKIQADFNGDNVMDTAWILINKKDKKWGLFVTLSSKNKTIKVIQIDENELKGKIFMGITPLKPGKHKTACGKGYWKCGKEEKPYLLLRNTGIFYFKFESAGSVYHWSNNESNFLQTWLSD